jgi:hypothetical protein
MQKHILSPNFSIDCVVFGFDSETLKVLLVERKLVDELTGNILVDDYTLIGNHVFNDEGLDEAANRVLYDLTGVRGIFLEQFHTFGDPERLNHEKDRIWLESIKLNPENRVLTTAYYSLLNINEVQIMAKERKLIWHPVNEPIDLAYDHKEILYLALEAVRTKIRTNPVGFELLPTKFTLSQLQKLYEEVLGISYDKRNFRKKISRMNYLVPLNEKQKGVAHKPAQLFMFSKDVYEKTKKEFLDFMV